MQKAVPSTPHSACPISCSNSTLCFTVAQISSLDKDPILNFAGRTEEPALFDVPTSRKGLSVKNYFVATNSRKTEIIYSKRLILTIMAIKSLGKLVYHTNKTRFWNRFVVGVL